MQDLELKVIPLGGVEEIGINSTVYEYNDQIIVIDLGLGFPGSGMYGVDYLVPNIHYLKKRKEQIKGLVITHGHLDHIGAIPYLLPELDFPPIYGTEFTLRLIKQKLEEFDLLEKVKMYKIDDTKVLTLGDFTCKFFRVNHSIPQSVGIVVETPNARVVHTGDFKFDNSPVNEPVADYAKIADMGRLGVDLLLSDSTNSLQKGHPISESEVADSLREIVEKADGRVIVASFAGLVGRTYQLIKVAEAENRKVAIAGYSMQQTLKIAEEIGYIKPKAGTIVPIQKINRYKDKNILILATGSQGEENAALSRMAEGTYKNIVLKKGDTVVISAGTVPGNNFAVQSLIDRVTATGAYVHRSAGMDFFTSGHGYQEDQKIMMNLVKPKYFMPIHGYQYFLREHSLTAQMVGIPESNIIIPKKGSIISGNKFVGFRQTGKFTNNPTLVSGLGIGDVGSAILSERQQLGNHGVIVISGLINANQQLVSMPIVQTRGFIYVRTNRDLVADIKNQAGDVINKGLKKKEELAELRSNVDSVIGKLVNKETGRQPMIFTLLHFEQPAH